MAAVVIAGTDAEGNPLTATGSAASGSPVSGLTVGDNTITVTVTAQNPIAIHNLHHHRYSAPTGRIRRCQFERLVAVAGDLGSGFCHQYFRLHRRR